MASLKKCVIVIMCQVYKCVILKIKKIKKNIYIYDGQGQLKKDNIVVV